MTTDRVLQVSSSLATGGMERVVLDLVRYLPEQGWRTAVATLESEGELAEEARRLGAPVTWLRKKGGVDMGLALGLARLARREGARVIHAHNHLAMFYAGLAGLWARLPVIGTRHGAAFNLPGRRQRWVRKVGTALCRYVVCVGADSRRVVEEAEGVPRAKVRLIYNGIATETYRPDPERRAKARADLGLAAEEPLIITVGRLSPEKDYATLIRALALLPGEPRLLVAGDGREMAGLVDCARKEGLARRVMFLGVRRDVPDLLTAADVFALSSLSEGVSIAILEAMAAGLPVVATAVGGTPEIVLPGGTGLLVPPGRPEELAGALGRLLGDPDQARALGAAGRRRVLEQFSVQAMAAGYANLYREVAEN